MSTPSETPTAARRHRLRTFGTLALAGPHDSSLEGQGAQRRRLALLAVLAAAGDAGRSRDQLLLLFWPDATQARARHSLEQLLYAIRSAVDKQAFTGVNPLRLNPDVIGSDVADFNDALERGELAAAVEHYTGPFLDGFYLSDAPEFEQWVAAERARLQRAYSGALEKLAGGAEAAGDFAAAVNWWHRLSETDPVSSANAAGLIRALMNSGDHAAALRHAERHEAIVRQEVGASAGPAIAELVAEARAGSVAHGTVPAKSPQSPPASAHSGGEPRPVPIAGVEPPPPEANAAAPAVLRPDRRFAPYVLGAAAVLLVIAAAFWSRSSRNGSAPPAASQRSIAVLPFANVSGNTGDAPLVDGLTEALISALSKIGNLRVIPRTSAFAFRDSDAGVRRIADSLGVANILEGSVQRNGEQLRVQVRLVDARDGATRWSETFDRELKDIFGVQSDIASAVARELDLRLTEPALGRLRRGSTPNIAAYELYLRGNDPVMTRSDSAARLARDYLLQAIALDSNFAPAHAALARLLVRAGPGETEISRRDRMAHSERAALKAIALDDSLGDAHAALGFIKRNRYDFAGAEAGLRRAIALEPAKARFREWLVQLYVITGRPVEALAEAQRAVALDPLSSTAHAEFAHALLANDRCDEALAALEKLKSLRPPLLRASFIAAQCYERRRMWPEAIAEVQRTVAGAGPRGEAHLGYLLARAGRTAEARRILDTMLERSRRINGGAFEVAIVYFGLGEKDQALAWLDRAVDDRSLVFDWVPVLVEELEADPRFDRIRRRAGLQKR